MKPKAFKVQTTISNGLEFGVSSLFIGNMRKIEFTSPNQLRKKTTLDQILINIVLTDLCFFMRKVRYSLNFIIE